MDPVPFLPTQKFCGPHDFTADLLIAAENGETCTVEMLIRAGANVHALEDAALRIAREKGYTEIVRMLSTA